MMAAHHTVAVGDVRRPLLVCDRSQNEARETI